MAYQQSNSLSLNGTSGIYLISGSDIKLETGVVLGKTPQIFNDLAIENINSAAPFTGDDGLNISLQAISDSPVLVTPILLQVAAWWIEVTLSKIEGILSVRGITTQRDVIVISAVEGAISELNDAIGYKVLADGRSANDGSFTLQWSGYQDKVIALYLDDFGTQWQPNTAYAEGDIVYPSIWNGWQYECIAVGTTDSIEPIWWHDEGSTSFSGTAAFKARQYLPALADGPITPYQWTEQ